MVTKKISELTSITTTTPNSDVLAIVSNNSTNQITVNNLINSAINIEITGQMNAASFTGSLSGNVTGETGSFEKVIISPISNGIPSYIGVEGEIIPGNIGENYFLFTYIGGAWRSGSLD